MDFSESINILQGSVQEKEKEVSLDTISKKQLEKIKSAYKNGREVAKNYYTDTIQPMVMHRQEVYDAPIKLYDKKFPALSESNKWISRDVKTTIDWMLPSLVEAFTGSSDPCDIKGQNVDDDEIADKVQKIIQYQITKKNDFYMFLVNFIREGMITNEGVAKVYWRRDEERTPMQVMVDAENVEQYLQMAVSGQIELKKMEIVDGIMAFIDYDEITVRYNAPVMENLSPSELRFTPDGRSIHDAKFVAHRKIVSGDYLKRKEQEGVYRNVEAALKDAGDSTWTDLDIANNEGLDNVKDSLSDGDNASKKCELYEAYLDVDYNDDGILEHIIVHAVGDVILSVQDNTFERAPFFIFSPDFDPYAPFGKSSYAQLLEQHQDLKTALIRQVVIAVAKNNRPQRFIDEKRIDMDALINNDEIIPVDGSPGDAIYIAPQIPISAMTMDVINYSQNEIESQSGSTKYNQGLDSNSLNKTATGVTAILGQADKKIKLIARIFAETVWVPIIKYLIKLNQQFIDPMQVFRLSDEMVSISPEELDIDFDLTVNTGQGAASKEIELNYLISIMQNVLPILERFGIADEKSYYALSKNMIERMGLRTIQASLNDPDSEEYKLNQMQKQQEQQRAEQQAMLLKQAELEAKTAPRLSANYKDLPIDAKAQALEKYAGIKASPAELVNKENLDADRWRY